MSTTGLSDERDVDESEPATDVVAPAEAASGPVDADADLSTTESVDADPVAVDADPVDADPDDVDPDDADPDASDASPAPVVGRRVNVVAAVLLVLVIAAAVVAGLVWSRVDDNNAADARAAAAVATARRVVVDLTTLNQSDVKASVNRILAETTGDFRNQFATSSGAFQSALAQGQVDSVGRADSAGLIKADSSSAEVLVASSSTVKNTQAPQGDARVYRMKVSLDRSNDTWLVSNVEFVS